MLTPESFAEHRSGLKDQEIAGNVRMFLLLLQGFHRSSPNQSALISPRDQVNIFRFSPTGLACFLVLYLILYEISILIDFPP